jgi:quercetin dioxygenase-like cupin family protein
MDIKRVGSQPSGRGPADWFTGTVRIDPLFTAPDPARVSGALVTFEPGAVEEIRPGDVVWFAPGEKHWHGAGITTAMSHIAIQERLDGSVVEWLEQVSETE